MKVEYIKCDICDRKIGINDKRYRHERIVILNDPLDFQHPLRDEQNLDICSSCFDELREWVREKKGVKEDEP